MLDDDGPFIARVTAPAPAAASDPLFVIIRSFDGGRSDHGPCLWEPPAGALPAVGDVCIVVRALEEDGEGEQTIVIAFDRNDSAALDGDLAAIDARVDALEGAVKVAFPFAAGWGNFGSGNENATYSKVGRLVLLQGMVTKTSGAPAALDVIGTLPVGFRPTSVLLFPVATGGTILFGSVQIQTDGDVAWVSGSTTETDFASLSGISFLVD